jgi:hypothetical protein
LILIDGAGARPRRIAFPCRRGGRLPRSSTRRNDHPFRERKHVMRRRPWRALAGPVRGLSPICRRAAILLWRRLLSLIRGTP